NGSTVNARSGSACSTSLMTTSKNGGRPDDRSDTACPTPPGAHIQRSGAGGLRRLDERRGAEALVACRIGLGDAGRRGRRARGRQPAARHAKPRRRGVRREGGRGGGRPR